MHGVAVLRQLLLPLCTTTILSMDIVLLIIACILLLAGLAGSVLPVLPGSPLSYAGLLVLQWSGYADFSVRFLVVWGVVTVAVTLLDYFLPVWMTRRFGGSRAATIGSGLGLVAGIFIFPPWGMILFPFLGALAGELINNSEDTGKAVRVAFGSFAAFVLGTGAKLVACVAMIVYAVVAIFS